MVDDTKLLLVLIMALVFVVSVSSTMCWRWPRQLERTMDRHPFAAFETSRILIPSFPVLLCCAPLFPAVVDVTVVVRSGCWPGLGRSCGRAPRVTTGSSRSRCRRTPKRFPSYPQVLADLVFDVGLEFRRWNAAAAESTLNVWKATACCFFFVLRCTFASRASPAGMPFHLLPSCCQASTVPRP